MFLNYFKIALRQILRNKTFSVINILGLAFGMGAFILISLWIHSEVAFDDFHSKRDRIYELWNRGEYSGKLECWNTTPKVAAPTLVREIPEVETAVRVDWEVSRLFTAGEKKFSLIGSAVDNDFLNVFDFPLLSGDKQTALQEAGNIVITETTARKLFGTTDAMGKQLTIDNAHQLTVSGIMADVPNNTRFGFEYLLSWKFLKHGEQEEKQWGNNSTHNYILLKENASFERAQEKVKHLRKKYQEPRDAMEMFFYPMSRWQLYSNFENGVETGGKIEYVRLFAIIAAFILLIACINFMNLSTARSEKRAREVGIRKTVGARRGELVRQFLGESLLISLIACTLAVLLAQLSLPWFNSLTHKQLSIHYANPQFWLYAGALVFFTGLLAGSYPAFFLSAFNPVAVLKGYFKRNTGKRVFTPRKVLVVVQFSFATLLIICTIVVKQQIQHVQNRQTGYNKDNLIYVFITGDIAKNYNIIKNELLQRGTAESVCQTSSPLTQGWSDTWGFTWRGKDPNDRTDFDRYATDEGIVKTAGLSLVEGRDFDLTRFPADSGSVLLNESAVKAMGFKQPVGETVGDCEVQYKVIGVVRDFILHSPYYPTRPMVILGCKSGWLNVVHIRLNGNNPTEQNLAEVERLFKKYNPGFLFEYQFISDDYARKFSSVQRTASLASLFTGLTIFISCLGLLGLSAYMAENRIKEIGIRKVLGASVAQIAGLLSASFVKLVLIALAIASPIAWWFMHNWLSDFPYHVAIQWWVFVLAGISAVCISLFTVGFQAVKAARANPSNSLRTE